jgi:hypothetical protein
MISPYSADYINMERRRAHAAAAERKPHVLKLKLASCCDCEITHEWNSPRGGRRASEQINGGDRFLFVFLSGNLIFVPRRRRHLGQPFSVVRR